MKIFPEIKKIAGFVSAFSSNAEKLKGKNDTDGIDFERSYLVSGCEEKNGHLYQHGYRLDNCGLVDDLYYCSQYTGYCEDDFYGTLYFKTNVPGQFVAVPFEM